MWQGIRRGSVAVLAAVGLLVAFAPTANATIAPTLTLDQSAGTAAGSTVNLGLTLKFAPSSSDSPDSMSLVLPPGLLANASINGGACLTTTDLNDNACEVGSGTVTSYAYGNIPITVPVTFDLVPPPAAGDLAGLAVNSGGTQIGSTADIKIRPSGDPAGVGVTLTFVLPNSLYGVPISITQISSTFDGLRYPTTCPSTPANVSVSVDSYGDPTVHTLSAPLHVTRCSSLSFAPTMSVTATRGSSGPQVALDTKVLESATEAPSGSMSLTFPNAVVKPNIPSLHLLCPNLAAGGCTPVGSVTATSPLYPRPLTGQAYLTGQPLGPTLTLIFPAPFPLTLVGTVDLGTNSTAFTGLPDIPLTDLDVSLNGGPYALFAATCAAPSGTATASMTDQNGDRTANASARVSVAGCSGGGGSSGGGGGSPAVTTPTLAGASSGHVSLSFRVSARRGAPKLTKLTIELPRGLSFVHGHPRVSGVTLHGARARSLTLSHGHLVIVLRSPVRSFAVRIGSRALRESAALRAKARAGALGRLSLTVITRNASGRTATIKVQVKP